MLHINDLSYRIEGRLLFEQATAAIPDGHKVGLVGRNGTGKTTLLRLISGEIHADDGSISFPKSATIAHVSQEAPGGPESLLETVLAAHAELAALSAEAETAEDAHRIAEIHTRLSDIDAHSAPSRAARILSGLGFDEAAQQRSCSEFSGGWRMRVALAGALFSAPDILLLDEPTNYLDLEGTLWLEDFIQTYPHTVLMVSHDRNLLNKAVDSILHLTERRLAFYTGGYDRFEETRREQQRLQLKLKKSQDDQRRKMEAFVERFRAKATKARQAQSRRRRWPRCSPSRPRSTPRSCRSAFPRPTARSATRSSVSKMRGWATIRKPVLRNVSLRLDCDDRVGLLGANGNGKSTLAKLLCWQARTAGRVPARARRSCEFGYFAQHQLDELRPKFSADEHIAGAAARRDRSAEAREGGRASASAQTRLTRRARSFPAARRRGCCSRSPPSMRRIS